MDILDKINDILILEEKCEYVVLVYFEGKIIHAIGYHNKPNKETYKQLRQEFREDKSHGLYNIVEHIGFIPSNKLIPPLTIKEISNKMDEINKELENIDKENK